MKNLLFITLAVLSITFVSCEKSLLPDSPTATTEMTAGDDANLKMAIDFNDSVEVVNYLTDNGYSNITVENYSTNDVTKVVYAKSGNVEIEVHYNTRIGNGPILHRDLSTNMTTIKPEYSRPTNMLGRYCVTWGSAKTAAINEGYTPTTLIASGSSGTEGWFFCYTTWGTLWIYSSTATPWSCSLPGYDFDDGY